MTVIARQRSNLGADSMRRGDLLIGLGLLVFAAIYFQQSFAITRGFASDRLGPAFFPRMLALALALMAVVLLVRAISGRSDPAPPPPMRIGVFIAVLALTAAYAFLLPHVGFLYATPVLLGAVIWVFGMRKWPGLIGTSLGITLVLYAVFGRMLRVLLP